MAEGLKVLVVDDEPVILESARRILAGDRLRVLTALDAEAALRMLETERPDIVISDLMLPGASGFDLLEAAGDHDPTLLVIITTGYSTVENAVVSFKKGAFDFVPKPFTYNELVSSVHRARRAIELRLLLRSWISEGGEGGGHLYLGAQTWARLEEVGSALLGVTAFQLQTIGTIDRIEFPGATEDLRQGGRLVRLHCADGMVHTLWSPLGGRVLACNRQLGDDALRADPFGEGWMVRILPADPEGERGNLIGP